MANPHNTPARADSGRLDRRQFPKTVAERMAQFCERFEVEPAKLRYANRAADSVLLTDELLQWFEETGASIDWIALGDPMPMAAAYRTFWRHPRPVEGTPAAGGSSDHGETFPLT